MRAPRIRSMRGDQRGGTALEMALVMPVLVPMLLGPLELGLYWWTNTTLRSVANMTARCVAIKNSACTTPNTQTAAMYAVALAKTWSGYAVIANGDVTATAVNSCNGVAGSFQMVTIVNHQWSHAFTYPFAAGNSTVTACYPN